MKVFLRDLNCANCAAKIEAQVREFESVAAASLNFMQKSLSVTPMQGADEEKLYQEICALVKKLEPEVTVAREEVQERVARHIDWKEIFSIGFGLALLLLGACLPSPWSIVVLVLAYLAAGWEVLLGAGKNLLHGQVFDENFLMAIATIGAIAIGEYPEAVAVMLFYRIGEMLEHYAVDRSRKSIRELLDIRPERATVVRGIEIKTVAPEEVNEGDVILIKPGERVPLDAKVLEGASSLDTSALTGESLPRDVAKGDMLLSGCVNLSGVLHARVVKSYEDSTVSTILNLMEHASEKKAKQETFITRFARVYTPIVVGVAVLVALLPPLVFAQEWNAWIYRALLFLMISCPCALVLSVPLTYFCGLGSASKQGILIKGSLYLDALAHVDTVIFDKTGTLTEGRFAVQEIVPNGMSEGELLAVAACVECHSNHPIAQSVCAAYGKGVDRSRISEVKELPGYGICAKLGERRIAAGNFALMERMGVKAEQAESSGAVVYLAADTVYLGHLVICDREKTDAAEAVSELKESGVRKTVMLTGDVRSAAEPIAQRLGLDEAVAELLPDDKVREVERLYAEKQGALVYVGDGINDAPSIARADVGIAMGAIGADAAIEAADVVVMTDEPKKLVTAIELSKRTAKIVRQNTAFALGIKLLVLALGVFGIAGMWQAVFADVGVSVLAVLNSSRALQK